MIKSYQDRLDLDFNALDSVFDETLDERVIERPGTAVKEPRISEDPPVDPASIVEDAPVVQVEEDWTTQNWDSLAKLFWRSAATTAPFIIADLLALSLSGLLPHVALRFFHLAGDSAPWREMLTLFPFVIAYWLCDLYSEIWVHPVIEFRQL